MLYDSNVNHEFIAYINRYFKGILLLRNKIERIFVFYELAEAFSNHACRFHIEIDFFDFASLTEDEKKAANAYFYSLLNETGYKFVSFSYKPQRSYEIDLDQIKSFIFHYQFVQKLFEGFIKDFLPEKCILKIEPLEGEPFFNYIRHFISHSKYSNEEKFSFEKEYFRITKRRFDFDCFYHSTLLNAAAKNRLHDERHTVTDIELCTSGGGDVGDIRKFVVENNIPFSIGYYTDVIDDIRIDAISLKEKIKEFVPERFVNIRPAAILGLLKKEEDEHLAKAATTKRKIEELGISEGDYIYVEKDFYGDSQDIGIVKEINLYYDDELEIKYNVLKKDLSESKLRLKSTRAANISYILKAEAFQQVISNKIIKQKTQLERFFKDKGIKNSLYRAIKKR